jgi:hypothetical protein
MAQAPLALLPPGTSAISCIWPSFQITPRRPFGPLPVPTATPASLMP